MRPLAVPSDVRWVLSFDFDGTMHDPSGSPPVPRDLFTLLEELRGTGVVWGINTGRSVPQMLEGFQESGFPFLPDWLVAREREIYLPDGSGRWVADEEWNRRCEAEIARLFRNCSRLLRDIREQVAEHTGAQWIEMPGEPAGIIARTEEEMEWMVGRIAPMTADTPDLGWQRNSIYLRFGHRGFQKGSSLCRIARRFGVGPSGCFAMGDSHNDLEMLRPGVAMRTACPSNAVAEVRAQIRRHGGFVSPLAHGSGVVAALRHFFR